MVPMMSVDDQVVRPVTVARASVGAYRQIPMYRNWSIRRHMVTSFLSARDPKRSSIYWKIQELLYIITGHTTKYNNKTRQFQTVVLEWVIGRRECGSSTS